MSPNRILTGVIMFCAASACRTPAGRLGDGGSSGVAGAAGSPTGSGGAAGAGDIDANANGDAAHGACEDVDGGSLAVPSYVDMNIAASGFSEHEGQTIFLVTRGRTAGVLGAGSTTVVGGAFTFRFPKGYGRATDQEILWLLDADGDGVCNDGAGDHTGYVLVSAVDPPGAEALAVAITDNHVRTTSSNADVCKTGAPLGNMLDMNVTGVGFDHDGRTVHLLTRTLVNGAIFGSGEASIAGGGFAFHFRRGFERFTYQEIFLFVDIDGDGRCAEGTDHTGYTVTPGFNPTQNVPVDLQITDNHVAQSARRADVCVVMNGCQLAP